MATGWERAGARRAWTLVLIGALLALGVVVTTAATPAGAAAPTYGRYCSSGAPIRSVATSQRVVAFTFDDGPWPTNTADVMTRFEQYGWPATFFMIGVNVQSYPDIARSVVARGFGVAAHSMTHTYGVSTIAREVEPTAALIQSVTGVRTSWFRSPGLTQSSTIDQAVYAAGMCNISTGSDLGDWVSPRASASTLCSRYMSALRPGAIILLHEGGSHRPTIDALDCMLSYTRQQGYEVVDLGALLAGSYAGPPPTTPPTPPPPTSGCRTSALGSRGEAVVLAQRAVMNDAIYLRGGADGIYGPYTAAAVATYQSRRGLPASGAVDDATAAAMGLCPTTPPPPTSGCRTSALGSRGEAVVLAQRSVMNDGIYLRGGADGIYGPYTAAAVATYQSRRSLPASGAVDDATAAAMGLCTTTTPPTPVAWTPISVGARGGPVSAIQRAVINAGIYLVGGADGYYGPYSAAAVQRYQSARGLPATGVVDEATAIAMGVYAPPAAAAATTTTTVPTATTTTTTTVPTATTTTTVPATTTTVPPTTTETTPSVTVPPDTAPTETRPTETSATAPADSAIDGLVWADVDGDGRRSAPETGVGEVTVRLLAADGALVATTVTDAAGEYSFGGLAAGSYVVEFVLPGGVAFSPGDVDPDDELDSDTATVVERTTPLETVAQATVVVDGVATDDTVDAGLVPVAPG